MICIIALVVFGILGIFSVKYRIIAKEAFDCVFRRLTLRKCTSGLDKRLKSQITGTLMRTHPRTGRFVYKRFEIISWFFTILLILSIAQSGVSIYNFVEYGNCNGKGSDEFCIFDPLNSRSVDENPLISEEISQCGIPESEISEKVLTPPIIGNSASFGNKDSTIKIIEFGCYSCHYTKEAEAEYQKIRDNYADKVEFIYKNFPIDSHAMSYEAAIAAECARFQDEIKYWDYHSMLFDHQEEFTDELFISFASELNFDIESFSTCYNNQESKEIVDADIAAGTKSNIYGTPTLFIKNKAVVGPKTYRELKKIIDSELN